MTELVMVALADNLPVDEARQMPSALSHSRIPVHGQTPDEVIDLVLRRDILTATADGRGATRVADLARPVHFITETAPPDELDELDEFIDMREVARQRRERLLAASQS